MIRVHPEMMFLGITAGNQMVAYANLARVRLVTADEVPQTVPCPSLMPQRFVCTHTCKSAHVCAWVSRAGMAPIVNVG